jgi:hypothetical protein
VPAGLNGLTGGAAGDDLTTDAVFTEGSSGDDTIRLTNPAGSGAAGNDGDDLLIGSAAGETLYGDTGFDRFQPGAGEDALFIGEGESARTVDGFADSIHCHPSGLVTADPFDTTTGACTITIE